MHELSIIKNLHLGASVRRQLKQHDDGNGGRGNLRAGSGRSGSGSDQPESGTVKPD